MKEIDSPPAILKRLDPLQRQRLLELARGENVQATITLLGWTDICPALAIGRIDGNDEINDLGRQVAALLDAEADMTDTQELTP